MAATTKIDGIEFVGEGKLMPGGQGKAQFGTKKGTKTDLALKTMPIKDGMLERTQAQVALELPLKSPFLAAALACDKKDKTIRHLAPRAFGVTLDQDKPRSFLQRLELASHLTANLAILEEMGIGHGDISFTNVLIRDDGAVFLIDFDNAIYSDPSIPKPRVVGQANIMAPELHGLKVVPTLESDRFSTSVFLSTLIFGEHPADRLASDDRGVAAQLSSGTWPQADKPEVTGVVPVDAIGPSLKNLFQQGFSLYPSSRPTADTFRRNLQNALLNAYVHDCGEGFIYEPGTVSCPWCKGAIQAPVGYVDHNLNAYAAPLGHIQNQQQAQQQIFTLRVFVYENGKRFKSLLTNGQSQVIGRENLQMNNLAVSRQHLEFKLHGETLEITNIGQSGSFIFHNGVGLPLTKASASIKDLIGNDLLIQVADTHLSINLR